MWSAEQKKGLAIVLGGHVLYGASRLLLGGAAPEAMAYGVGLLAAAAMVYGSAIYIRGKGYALIWGLGGFVPLIGIGTLMLIPDFPSSDADPGPVQTKQHGNTEKTTAKH